MRVLLFDQWLGEWLEVYHGSPEGCGWIEDYYESRGWITAVVGW